MVQPAITLAGLVQQLEAGEELEFSDEFRELARQAIQRAQNRPPMTLEQEAEALADWLSFEEFGGR